MEAEGVGNNTILPHDDVIQWKYFSCYWPLWGESTGDWCIPLTNTSDAELWCFLWSAPEQTVEKTNEAPVIFRNHGAHYDVTVMYIVIHVMAEM